jgi:hypothetical protein
MLLGVLVALVPFLGFPNSWDRVIFLVLGGLVVGLGIVLRRNAVARRARKLEAAMRAGETGNEPSALPPHEQS